jgi:hypothetical protein
MVPIRITKRAGQRREARAAIGQTGDQVKFLSRGHGYTLFLPFSEAVLVLHASAAKPIHPNPQEETTRPHGKRLTPANYIEILVAAIVNVNARSKLRCTLS